VSVHLPSEEAEADRLRAELQAARAQLATAEHDRPELYGLLRRVRPPLLSAPHTYTHTTTTNDPAPPPNHRRRLGAR
jgi:hypothetical protein